MIRVHYLQSDPVVRFAAKEAARYLSAMSGHKCVVRVARCCDPDAPGVWIGTADRFDGHVASRPDMNPEGRDDAVYIRARNGHVVLSGPHPRSVIFAVYRYLESLGCRWLRPGRDGERIPRVANPLAKDMAVSEVASARHRVICIEGSCSVPHVVGMIDYAAKRGFNAYFTQFRNSYTFFEHWYGVERNRRPVRTPYSRRDAIAATAQVKKEARRRGLMLHTVGHGWTCEPFGIPGEKWEAYTKRIPSSTRKYFAMLQGKRDLFHGIPLNTQICYSNRTARDIMVRAVVDYAAAHPEEEYIHVWLADGTNNHCECAGCRAHRPSELYVRMLNEIDAGLAKRRLRARIVFLAYVDLLWAPRKEKIATPDRFVLMFAPITRSYACALTDQKRGAPESVMPYRRNKLVFPSSPQANLKLLAGWRRMFSGECVDFDYHLWRAMYNDPAQMRLARVIHKDIASLPDLGMNGFISCQGQRVSFPTGLFMHVLGKTLWNRKIPFDAMARDYFADVFGKDGPAARAFMTTLSDAMAHETLDPTDNRKTSDRSARETAMEKWLRVPAVVDGFMPLIRRGCRAGDEVTTAAWRIMDHFAWYAKAYADLYRSIDRRDADATRKYADFARALDSRLPQLHHVLDTYMARGIVQHAMAMQGLPFEEHIVVQRRRRRTD